MPVIKVPVSDEEHAKVKAEAQRLGMPMAGLLRLLARQWTNGEIRLTIHGKG